MLNIPGTAVAGSRSPSPAHTDRRLPDGCFTSPKGTRESTGTGNGNPSSSSHSRTAASRGSSGSTYSPLGTDQAASSLPVQYGPPMCAISTCTPSSVLPHSSLPPAVGPPPQQDPRASYRPGLQSVVRRISPAEFVLAHTHVRRPPYVPEVQLHLADDSLALWEATQVAVDRGQVPPPFWAFVWAGGQAISRYLLPSPA